MNIYTNYNVKNVSTNTNLNKQINLSKRSYSNNAIQDNVSFKMNATKKFYREFNASQHAYFEYDKFFKEHIHFGKLWKIFWYGACQVENDLRRAWSNIDSKIEEIQAKTLDNYRNKPNELFRLLQKKDKYGNPNIESLEYKNIVKLATIFKDTPEKLDYLLSGRIEKILSKKKWQFCHRFNSIEPKELVSSLKNNPNVLEEILSIKEERTGKTLMHRYASAQNIEVLEIIGDVYKNSPEKLKKIYSEKDSLNEIRYEKSSWVGGDGGYEYNLSEKNPLEYLTPENLAGLREKYPILNDIK